MAKMYCPQCGRDLDLDSGDARFCRYCGFSLLDTKEALQGYSQQKRTGFSVVSWSYALLLIVTLLLHGKYFSVDTGWGYWLSAALIVMSVSLFVSAAVSTLKPAMFLKPKRRDAATLEPHGNSTSVLESRQGNASLLTPASVPVRDLTTQDVEREFSKEPRSVIEGTTKRLNEPSAD